MPEDGATAPESADVPAPAYPDRWEGDVVLADGGTVHLRPIRPSDAELLAAFHERQSSESIYFRFFSPRPRLSERELERFTTVDYFDRMAFVASLGDEMVGMAGYDRFHGSREAEVAFIVDDAHQRRGIATVMLEYLATAGREVGLDAFTAQVLPSNRKMLRVFQRAGFDTSSAFTDGVIEVRLGLEPTESVLAAISDRARASEIRSVERLIEPRSVAVIGASRDPSRLGHRILRNLLEHHFVGPVYPVNRNASHVASVRAWPDVLEIPDTIDLAVIAVPAHDVLDVVDQCAEKRVRALIVVSSGFRSIEPYGPAAERALVERARGSGMRLLGPTAMGVLNTRPGVSLCAIAGGTVTPNPGRAAVLSQSGALGLALLEHGHAVGVGVSTFIGVGDRADVSGNDLLAYWEQDDRTDCVLVYYDSLGNPTNFNRIARRVGRVKPIVMVKSGGALPVAHGNGAGWPTSATMEELLRQAGVIRVDSIREMFDVGRLVLHQPLPRGRRVAIVANAAGPARLAADACVDAGLLLADLSPRTRGLVAGSRPAGATTENPIDLTFDAGPHHYEEAVRAVSSDPGVDVVLAVYAPPVLERVDEVARAIAVATDDHPDVAVVATFLGRPSGQLSTTGNRALCFFPFPEEAVQALGRLAAYAEWRDRAEGVVPDLGDLDRDLAREIVADAVAAAPTGCWLDPVAAEGLLAAFGITMPPGRAVVDADDAVTAAEQIGWPVALKATGLERFSATEAGGVALDLHDADALRAAHGRMAALLGAAMHPAEVQAMVPAGVDVRIAAHQHPSYGGVLVLGLGGALGPTEAAPPVRVLPLTDVDADSLVVASSVGPLLAERPGAAAASAALSGVLVRLAALVEAVPEIAEVVLDPVMVSADGAAITKAAVRVAPWRWDDHPHVRRLGG